MWMRQQYFPQLARKTLLLLEVGMLCGQAPEVARTSCLESFALPRFC